MENYTKPGFVEKRKKAMKSIKAQALDELNRLRSRLSELKNVKLDRRNNEEEIRTLTELIKKKEAQYKDI